MSAAFKNSLAITAISLLLSGASLAATPAPESAERRAPRSLEEALADIARRHNVAIVFNADLIADRVAPNVDDSSLAAALRTVLEGSSLDYTQISRTTYALRSAPLKSLTPDILPARPSSAVADAIVVTATRAQFGFDLSSRQIINIDRETLESLAVTAPAEAVYQLPQSVASVTSANTTFFGASAGLNLADIRGMSAERTLVLVNGRRRTSTPGGNATTIGVDMNSMAEPFLERIEVSSHFNSALRGSDAVAGAVNFVTRQIDDGFTAGVRYGVSQQGDADEVSIFGLAGTPFADERGQASFGFNYVREDGLTGDRRDATAVLYGVDPNGDFRPGFGGSAIGPEGQFIGVLSAQGNFTPSFFFTENSYLDGNGGLSADQSGRSQLYNWSAVSSVIIPQSKYLGLADLTFDASDTIKLYAEAQIGAALADAQLSPLPAGVFQGVDSAIGDAVPVSIDNPSIPDAVLDLIPAGEFGVPAAIVVNRRFVELGPRRRMVNRRYNDAVMGVNWRPNEDLLVDAYYRYGRNVVRTTQNGRIDRIRLLTALDPLSCSMTPGCEAIDIFRSGGITSSGSSFLIAPDIERKLTMVEHEVVVDARSQLNMGPIPGASIHAGASFRRTRLQDVDIRPTGIDILGSFGANDHEGALSVADLFADATLPVLEQWSPIGQLEISTAYRATLSPSFDTAHNATFSMDWAPINGVSAFSAYSTGQRPPNILELYYVGTTTQRFAFDPCSPFSIEAGSQVETNCGGDTPLSVGENFFQTNFLPSTTGFGNPGLAPEDIRVIRAGATLEPTAWFDGTNSRLELAANWLDYRIDNWIGGQSQGVGECFASSTFLSDGCGVNPLTGAPLIGRDATTRQLTNADTTLTNDGTFSWRGLDLELRFTYQPQSLGLIDRIWISGLHTYTAHAERKSDAGEVTRFAGFGGLPRHETVVGVGFEGGPARLTSYMRRRGETYSAQLDEDAFLLEDFTTFDASLNIDLQDDILATIAIENMFNAPPPIAAVPTGPNTLPQFYDLIGRRVTLGVRMTF